MKTGIGKNNSGYVVIKAFQVPSDFADIEKHEKYLTKVRNMIDPKEQTHLAPFTVIYIFLS